MNYPRTYIIAEAGVNHNGDISKAMKLIDIASSCGADAVKFQAFRTSNLILENVKKAPYQMANTGTDKSQSEMLRSLELKKEHYLLLRDYCSNKNLDFLITPFDETSLEELEELNLDAYKIASTDTTNISFLRKIAKTGKRIFLSTGMCYENEVKKAVNAITEINPNLVILQCTANYPTPVDEVNLNVITTLKKEYNYEIGFSDHTEGVGASPFAVALGATVIEKHFTIDKTEKGPDHKASLSPEELSELVSAIRTVEKYLGSNIKKPTKSELSTRKSLQKCLVAKKVIRKGELFNETNITAKRTGGVGISAIDFDDLNGQKSTMDYRKDDIIVHE